MYITQQQHQTKVGTRIAWGEPLEDWLESFETVKQHPK